MRKVISLFLIVCMLAGMSACGNSSDPKNDADLNPDTQVTEAGGSDQERNQDVYEIVGTRAYDYDFDNMTAIEFASCLALGWNLGNTLDATGGNGTDPISQETSWGNPEVTQQLIQTVADYGFTTIRIPVTWYNFTDENYNIDEAFLARVKQIVDWSLEEGLFVIINTHHEGEWLVPSEAEYEQVSEKLCAMWTQIGTYFQDYDERLIFEGMNEPRVGDDWNGNTTTQDVVNRLGLDFVETIRGLDGYNKTRFLMVPCYAATSNSNVWKKYEFPDDERVILSIHAYLPYDFALNTEGIDTWSAEDPNSTRDIDNLFKNISDVLLKEGRAAVIGEYGCMAKNNNLQDRIDCTAYFVQKAAFYRVPVIWWDNNAFTSGETFGLIRRNFNDCLYTGIIEAMINNWYYTEFSFGKEE